MPRLRDWQCRLSACLAERWARPFAWGLQDCCLFAADCAYAVTGVDPAADERGTYDTPASAARLLAGLGGVPAIAASRFGPPIDVRAAAVGDIGLHDADGRPTLVVCAGRTWIGPGPECLHILPPGAVTSAWRVC